MSCYTADIAVYVECINSMLHPSMEQKNEYNFCCDSNVTVPFPTACSRTSTHECSSKTPPPPHEFHSLQNLLVGWSLLTHCRWRLQAQLRLCSRLLFLFSFFTVCTRGQPKIIASILEGSCGAWLSEIILDLFNDHFWCAIISGEIAVPGNIKVKSLVPSLIPRVYFAVWACPTTSFT